MGGQVDGADQDLVLGLEPGHRLLVTGQVFRRDAGTRRGEGNRLARWFEQESSGIGGVQVVVEHPVGGRLAGLLVINCLR